MIHSIQIKTKRIERKNLRTSNSSCVVSDDDETNLAETKRCVALQTRSERVKDSRDVTCCSKRKQSKNKSLFPIFISFLCQDFVQIPLLVPRPSP